MFSSALLRTAVTRRSPSCLLRTTTPATACCLSTQAVAAPSAFDVVVQLTFVDPNGARRQVPGYVGKTLHETCTMHKIDIGPNYRAGDDQVQRTERWIEPTFGEGPSCGYDHVVLHGKGSDTAIVRSEKELSQLSDYWDDDEVFDNSRLASMVTLTKEMDGMVVYVPDRLVCDIP